MTLDDVQMAYARLAVGSSIALRRRLWQKLAKLLSNGVPIMVALESIHSRYLANGASKDPMAMALGVWLEHIRNGQRLGVAIDGWVPRDERMLISAGERSGQLDKALVNATEIMVAKSRIKKAVFGGLAYPVVMAFMALAVLIMFSYKVIPAFTQVVPGAQWHGVAKALIVLSSFTRAWLPFIVGTIVLLLIAFSMSLPRYSEGLRVRLDRHIPYSVYRTLQGGAWMISLAALVDAGVRMEMAIEDLSEGAPKWLAVRCQACLRGMRAGLNLGDALARSGYEFPDREIIDDLGVYARLSGIEQALSTVGHEWISSGVETIQGLMKVVFGISVLSVGLFIAFMVGGLITMELQMSSAIQTAYH